MNPAVLITGGAKRIGAIMARHFAAAGWHVVIHYGQSRAEAEALAATLPSAQCVSCELNDPDAAVAINATGPGNLAAACAGANARLIHISSDYVFSGNAGRPYEISDATGPLGAYGRSKLGGESAVLAALPGAHIVRTSWVYTGGSGTDFVAVMRKLAGTDRCVDVVDDQIGSPTYAPDLVRALLEIAAGDVRGPILHVANAGAISRCEQARAVFAELGADPERVRAVGTADVPRPARRPKYSALSMTESVRAGLTPLRPWRDALVEALAAPL